MTHRRILAIVTGAALLVAVTACDDKTEGDDRQARPPAGPATTELPTGTAKLLSPADGAQVNQCAIFTGQANLPGDKTLVLGVRNTDNGNAERYFEAVKNWEYPGDLKAWTGAQYFGSKDSSVGQHFRVELLIVDLGLATKALRNAKTEGWHAPDNPAGSTIAAHITLARVAGPGPAECS
ncbi:hypothetical protein ACWT_2859 [Actinoplanes sp. SE50]|uniref:hypothetical protein n=1 Tax=unclassified Actinoplanes TaxID=2626549 RepID=UPI00023EC426|nr:MULTISPECIES: hypothetical protein [unclassified Actinoplanes]AEV83582.1 hypothetical protein ACPL_2687 [Actinoplanes sp. SE50/110]ATO82274.1 hypothetical protein ACWT_2859 [Actinoplanes sp. SE50]SLL99681.1 hypothetical protein ACSP50_2912 [Actinoplanes sp. SE50/110]